MTELEVARLVAEIIGILGFVGGGLVWLMKLIGRVLHKLDGVNERLDELNGSVKRHEGALAEQREINAWLAGKLGEQLPTRGER